MARTRATRIAHRWIHTPAITAPATGNSQAEATAAGKRFAGECRRDHVDLSVTYQAAMAAPARYAGQEIVLFGRLAGVVQVGSRSTYLVSLPNGAQASVAGDAIPGFDSTAAVAILAKVPAGWDTTADLMLVDMVSQYDSESVRVRPVAPRQVGSRPSISPTSPTTRASIRQYLEQSVSRSYSGIGLEQDRAILAAYAGGIRYFNPRLSLAEASTIAGHIIWYSRVNNVDARLVMAVIAVESDFDTRARSDKGAMGLAQLMPGTARDLGVQNAYDPEQNIAGAVKLIRWHLAQNATKQDPLALALACYNAGENAVKKYHGVPPYRETVAYIKKVEQLYRAMCRNDS